MHLKRQTKNDESPLKCNSDNNNKYIGYEGFEELFVVENERENFFTLTLKTAMGLNKAC